LSGGEQQRTAIARALVFDPPIVLADEPTGNLDSASGAQVMDVLRSAQRQLSRTVVVVTHDPRIAASADEAVELRDGRIAGTIDLGRDRDSAERRARIVGWQGQDE
jgi:putative ABC transport system ATP-binding protein